MSDAIVCNMSFCIEVSGVHSPRAIFEISERRASSLTDNPSILRAKPDLLIADEPTTALDVTVQAEVVELLKYINKKHNTSILFISHDLSLVSTLCDRVLVMQKGRIVESGTASEIFNNPQMEYTQKLISSIPRVDLK